MFLSSRVKEIEDSITLKLNAKAVALTESGRNIYNLTAGQLPFRPQSEFIETIRGDLNFLKSFQYSPVAGFPELCTKVLESWITKRDIDPSGLDHGVVISNGGKHAISNVLWSLIDPGEEVILLTPYWVTYPELIKICRGIPIVIGANIYDAFIPSLEDIRKAMSAKTKAIIINSPNNPSGIHYPKKWMEDLGELLLEYPDVVLISDEIYSELNYYDPKPTYPYEFFPELLKRTVIIDGISKCLAATGLRIGFTIAPKKLTQAITKMQGQTSSGANSLIQRALITYDWSNWSSYLGPVKGHLRRNCEILMEKLREAKLGHCWYQSRSAFYYLIDFGQTPAIDHYRSDKDDSADYSHQICDALLEDYGVAVVPGEAFGAPNTARLSLVLEPDAFREAIDLLMTFLTKEGP